MALFALAVIVFLLKFRVKASSVSPKSGYFNASILTYPVISGEKALPERVISPITFKLVSVSGGIIMFSLFGMLNI